MNQKLKVQRSALLDQKPLHSVLEEDVAFEHQVSVPAYCSHRLKNNLFSISKSLFFVKKIVRGMSLKDSY